RIDIGEIGERGGDQVAVGECRTLGSSRRAAGIEKPGRIVLPPLDQRDAIALRKLLPFPATADYGASQVRQILGERRHRLRQIRACKAKPRAGMAEDVAELLAVQLGKPGSGGDGGAARRGSAG